MGDPPKTPGNSSVPPSQGKKPNRADKPQRDGPRKSSLGRKGGGRMLAGHPDEAVIARPMCCAHCQAVLHEDDHTSAARFDKIDLRKVRPVVTRVEQYAGHCQGCGGTTLAPLPEGLKAGTPFSLNIVALAIYLRFAHAISPAQEHRSYTTRWDTIYAAKTPKAPAWFRSNRPTSMNYRIIVTHTLRHRGNSQL